MKEKRSRYFANCRPYLRLFKQYLDGTIRCLPISTDSGIESSLEPKIACRRAVTGGRRPDFVLPSLVVLKAQKRAFEEAMVLSAKTTLRERWKQVAMEKFSCALFLATVDDRVSAAAIDDMSTQGIHLVVPESLKKSKETCYNDKANVITFREFFDEEISSKRPGFLKT